MLEKFLTDVQRYGPGKDYDDDYVPLCRCDKGNYIQLDDPSFENFMKEVICQAHMAGQIDAGCKEPSWSNAHTYFTIL